jgi:hypothetical protein
MTWTDIFNGIGDLFTWIFTFMPFLGKLINPALWVIIFCLLVYWTLQLSKYSKSTKTNKNGRETKYGDL